jgi:hypothetical protein
VATVTPKFEWISAALAFSFGQIDAFSFEFDVRVHVERVTRLVASVDVDFDSHLG